MHKQPEYNSTECEGAPETDAYGMALRGESPLFSIEDGGVRTILKDVGATSD